MDIFRLNGSQYFTIELHTFVDRKSWYCIMKRWNDGTTVGKGFCGKYKTYKETLGVLESRYDVEKCA